jgi:hypothetical protein
LLSLSGRDVSARGAPDAGLGSNTATHIAEGE